MRKKLLVIILGEKNIDKTIESLYKQSYKDIQVVTSCKKECVKSLQSDKVTFIDEKYYKNNIINIETLIELSGDYFTILNSGDTVGVDFYRQLIDKTAGDDDVIMGNTVFEINGQRLVYNILDSCIPDIIDKETFKKFYTENSNLMDNLLFFGNKIYNIGLLKKVVAELKSDEVKIISKKLLEEADEILKYDIDAIFHIPDHSEIERHKANNYYSISTNWDYGMEVMKEHIISEKIKFVSFDVFDTLILRPFLEPKDEIYLLNDYFNKLFPNGIGMEFDKMRFEAEIYARNIESKKENPNEDITIDDIYEAIHTLYGVDYKILRDLKEKEIENEIRYCRKRNTSFELYKLARYFNKQVIIVSDMYLPVNVIKKMLDKCGYSDVYKYYVSSEIKLTKAKGTLYDYVLKDLNVFANEVIHIGDNWTSDWKNAGEHGINNEFLPRTINLLYDTNLGRPFFKSLPFWQDNISATNFFTIRCMLAQVANKYFDNPYKKFNEESTFNIDVKLFGYYALGMHLFGLTKWLLDDLSSENVPYDKIEFMARDGYLPIKAYNTLKSMYDEKKVPEAEYFHISRKALIPIIFSSESDIDLYKLIGSINIFNHTPCQILKYLDWAISYGDEMVEQICNELEIKKDEEFKEIYTFNLFLNSVKKNLYNKEKVNVYIERLKKYFNSIFEGKVCTFDIGYSARPESIISRFCNKSIDAYFTNINEQSAYDNARYGKFKLKTYFGYKPVITGSIREILISKQAPSCVGYDCSTEEVKPKFEEYEENIDSANIVGLIQENALEFVTDMVQTYGKEIRNFEYYSYYTNIPLDLFINSPEQMDRQIINIINFEDDVGMGNRISLDNLLEEERKKYNQINSKELFRKHTQRKLLEEKNIINLTDESRFSKLIYYLLFRRDILKRRIREILKNIFHKRN